MAFFLSAKIDLIDVRWFALIRSFLVSFAFLISSLTPANAIPPDLARQKLKMVAAFLVADSQGGLIYDEYEDQKKVIYTMPVFLEVSEAESRIFSLKSTPALKGAELKLIATNLYQLPEVKDQARQALQGKVSLDNKKTVDFVFPVVLSRALRNAVSDLHAKNKEHVDHRLITGGIPVFYSSPMVEISPQSSAGKGKKQVFFLGLAQLIRVIRESSEAASNSIPEIRVASLASVLKHIESVDEDKYYIFPTPGYLKYLAQ